MKQLSRLSKRGPYPVLVGKLDYAGLPGLVYTPEEGDALPAVAFGHDWMTDIKRYHRTLKHLASWGIVVAAPNTEKGVLPDHRGFASDLETCLQILAGVKLGTGKVTVAPGKLGMAGHGMGASCALLASAQRSAVKAVVALYPAKSSPSAEEAAKAVSAPGLVLGTDDKQLFEAGNPEQIALNWKGEVCYREIKGGNQHGFSEGMLSKAALGLGLPQYSQQDTARGLMTGFLLGALNEDKKYSGFLDPAATAKKITSYTREELQEKVEEEQGI